MQLHQIAIFLPAAIAVGATPGANNLLAFATASRSGARAALLGLTGRMAAFGVLTVLVSLGLDALLRSSMAAFLALKWAGVAYLLFLAWKFWTAPVEEVPPPLSAAKLMRREFLTLMGNPKAYLLMTAFVPQFVLPGEPALPQLLQLGALYICAEGVAAAGWIAAGAALGQHALTPLRQRLVNRGAGLLMVGAAALLARARPAA